MRKISLFLLLFFIVLGASAQKKYSPTWESLDTRPIEKWYTDAKFGIFIHWGLYSVPAWTPKGTYSEWYQYWIQTKNLFGNGKFKGDEVYVHHVENYGEDFSYYNFGDMFTAKEFNADEWAKLIELSGAKYTVITSKHHDGFCLWPSEHANKTWERKWNAKDLGAKRDLLKEFEVAVKKTNVKFGTYYSLYEWFNPLWLSDRERFVTEHMHPQFKDLVQNYKPEIVFADGEWDMTSDKWRTPELLAWLFNESAVKDNVVINDRWGKGIRFKHGGYYSPEYETAKNSEHPWEETRGIGFSFGYNKNEDSWDYATAQTLIYLLLNVVSNGGNLLLDIGPDGDGNIPPIMQDRLLEMGKWLKINGEAIYGTKKWEKSCQWSEGKQDWKPEGVSYIPADYILKQTVEQQPGYAVREIFFTQKENSIYAITPKYPKGELVIKDFKIPKGSKITMLGAEGNLEYKQKGGNLIIKVPYLTPDELPCNYAWSFKIEYNN